MTRKHITHNSCDAREHEGYKGSVIRERGEHETHKVQEYVLQEARKA